MLSADLHLLEKHLKNELWSNANKSKDRELPQLLAHTYPNVDSYTTGTI